MHISEILRTKGDQVATAKPRDSVAALVDRLRQYNIGAMVVLDESGEVCGIVSERDVVRGLVDHGTALLGMAVSAIMTPVVVTCTPEDTVDDLTVLMTERRIRHIPVLVDGGLAGIVSIGDVVKSRISQLEDDRRHLENYLYR